MSVGPTVSVLRFMDVAKFLFTGIVAFAIFRKVVTKIPVKYAYYVKLFLNLRLIILFVWSTLRTVRFNKRI